MVTPSRLAVFLLHLTVSLLKTELVNPLRLVLAPECLPGFVVCGRGSTEKLCCEGGAAGVMEAMDGIADGWEAGNVLACVGLDVAG